MIWFALIIPIVAILILAIGFTKRITWWEYLLILGIPIACIAIGKYASVMSQVMTTEYWNNYIVSATYDEPWNEKVSCRHPKYETRTRRVRDADGKGYHTETYQVQVGWQHLYDVDHHPAQWYMEDDMGGTYAITSQYFENLCTLWNMRQFKDMQRHYHTIDGDRYVTLYDKIFNHTEPIVTKHLYENRVKCSKSVFNFETVTTNQITQYKLFNYPPYNGLNDYNPVLGISNPEASRLLQIYNGLNGSTKQLHMLLLVFKNQPIQAAIYQQSLWKNGNKNEFVVCVGVDSNQITWTKCFSWTDAEILKVTTAREIGEMKTFDCKQIVEYMGKKVAPNFQRKHFSDFKYITVQPTPIAIIITYVITLLVTIGLSILSVMDGIDWDDSVGGGRSYYNRVNW
jgi:hypothetical protein